MDQPTEDFLRAEYDTAWAHIREIDNRRLRFVEFYISLNAVLATAITAVISRSNNTMLTIGNVILVLVGTIIVISAGVTILGMIRSERRANVRFRSRVNYIRGIFLEHSSDIKIKRYLSQHAELNTPTERTQDLSRLGGTLRYVFRFFFGTFAIWASVSLTMLALTFVHIYG